MRAKCVCCIPLYSAPFSRANIILPCRAGFSGCPRRNHQPVAGIRAGGYLISVATHRGVGWSNYRGSPRASRWRFPFSLHPFVSRRKREAPGGTHRRIVTSILKSKTDRALPSERDLEGWDWQIPASERISIHSVSNPFQRSVSISTLGRTWFV